MGHNNEKAMNQVYNFFQPYLHLSSGVKCPASLMVLPIMTQGLMSPWFTQCWMENMIIANISILMTVALSLKTLKKQQNAPKIQSISMMTLNIIKL